MFEVGIACGVEEDVDDRALRWCQEYILHE